MSPEEYSRMKDEAQAIVPSSFLSILNRSKETLHVPFKGIDDTEFEIEIRAMLNKTEVKQQSKFFKAMNNIQYVDDDYYYWLAGPFLDTICVDPELDTAFWRRDDIDPYIIQELIAAFIKRYK